jgi:uncharacterized protein
MIAPFSAVLLASLLGSTHCAGMCGGFLAIAVAPPLEASRTPLSRPTWSQRSSLLAAYNVGRLITYSVLGLLAGAIGSAVDLGGRAIGLQRAAAVSAGVFILVFGLIAVLRHLNIPIRRTPIPPALQRIAIAAHRAADRLPPFVRALTIGLLTTLLPCGWLWAFVVTAAGTGSIILGPAVMAVFWLGTLPVMVGLGVGVQTLAGRLGPRLPLITSLLLVAAGIYTVSGRMLMPPITLTESSATSAALDVPDPDEPHCPLCDTRGDHAR